MLHLHKDDEHWIEKLHSYQAELHFCKALLCSFRYQALIDFVELPICFCQTVSKGLSQGGERVTTFNFATDGTPEHLAKSTVSALLPFQIFLRPLICSIGGFSTKSSACMAFLYLCYSRSIALKRKYRTTTHWTGHHPFFCPISVKSLRAVEPFCLLFFFVTLLSCQAHLLVAIPPIS